MEIRGVVQGVGFRPFVYRIAARHFLSGWVRNSSEGVVIEAEGGAPDIAAFLGALEAELPPLARIDDLGVTVAEPLGTAGFEIELSRTVEGGFALVPPDVGTCPDCVRDFTDPGNRRYGYPFTNCTNCGPRYSIIRDVPYDRPLTTMAGFPLCAACGAEYGDPSDRRFHAEPNACAECGPSLALLPTDEPGTFRPVFCAPGEIGNVLAEARRLLREGGILAVKGLGGFHLVCDARNEPSVALLRERKRRSGKAFALMVRSADVAERLCVVGEEERALLESPRRPIVLLGRRPDSGVAPAVAPGVQRLGLMLPYTPLHRLLFDDALDALVMTSGNLSEEPVVSDNQDAWSRLRSLADFFLLHNRPIQARVDDSVVQVFEGREYPVRRSRGYAPDPIRLAMPLAEVLACGGELKNTLCLTKDHYAILSQHIGDLENLETMVFFKETLAHLKRFFRVTPSVAAHDLHPNYLSTRFALRESGLRPLGVQHHHAHIASCMADNGIDGRVIGVAFDGTGYGTDGNIWGGEFLVCGFQGFERAGHLAYVPLAGGDSAVRQPWRSALAYLRSTFGPQALALNLRLFREVPEARLRVVDAMLAGNIQTIPSSSCGRLFDAVSSLLGICHETTYEGQAAVELEMAATEAAGSYPFVIAGGVPFRVDLRSMVEALVREVLGGVSSGVIAARFHNTLAAVVAAACNEIRTAGGMNRVCLSGGTFQNLRLLRQTVTGLRAAGFEVFTHHRVPANDGGLALGQAVIASRVLEDYR